MWILAFLPAVAAVTLPTPAVAGTTPGEKKAEALRSGDWVTALVEVQGKKERISREVRLELVHPEIAPGASVTLAGGDGGNTTLSAPEEPRADSWTFEDAPDHYALVRVEVRNASGELVGEDLGFVPGRLLQGGFFTLAADMRRFAEERARGGEVPPGLEEALRLGVGFLFGLRGVILNIPPMKDVLELVAAEVVRKPSFLSRLGSAVSGSVSLRLSISGSEPARVDPREELAYSGAAYRMPIRILIEDRVASELTLVVVPAQPPLAIVAGIVSLEGRHPKRRDRRFTIRVLSSGRSGG